MKFLNKTTNYGVSTSLLIATLLITGCSQKESSYSVPSSDINKVYKANPSNTSIRNSKAMHRATLKPYTVFGVRYYPKVVNVGDDFRGIASWYGPNFHAKKTSNGETYNMYAMTAAHKTLPMNTMVKVYNLENNKTAIVRVNDRGPFVAGRIIDLSNKAAHKIDMVRNGTAKVKITIIGYNGQIENGNAPINELPYNITEKKPALKTKIKNAEVVESLAPLKIEKNMVTPVGSFNIQVGAFSRMEGALQTKEKYQSLTNGKYNVEVKKILSGERYLHKVYITGFDSYNHAQLFKDSNGLNGMIIEK